MNAATEFANEAIERTPSTQLLAKVERLRLISILLDHLGDNQNPQCVSWQIGVGILCTHMHTHGMSAKAK